MFSEEYVIRPGFDGLEFPTIPLADNIALEKSFSEEEVKSVIMHFGNNKAPGSDGFTMEFFNISCYQKVLNQCSFGLETQLH